MKKHAVNKGFTIVELVVVIAVLSILVGLTVVTYGSWRERTAKSETQSDLRNAALAMNNYRNFNNVYPTGSSTNVFAAIDFKASSGVTVQLVTTSQTSYCIQATSKSRVSVVYFINSTTKTPTAGTC